MVTQAQAQEAATQHVEAVGATHGDPAADTHATTQASGGAHEAGVFPPFDPSTFASQLLWLAITFGALYLVMSRIALPRIGGILDDRKGRIDADLAAADASRQKTDAAIAAYEGALAAAKAKAQGIANEKREAVQAKIASTRSAAEAKFATEMSAAEASIAQSKAAALTHVDEIATETAQSVVSQLVGEVSADSVRAAVAKASKE